MKLVFVSNYFNHQQKPLCEHLYQKLGADFCFLATKPMREERKKLGYGMHSYPDYVKCAYDWRENKEACLKLINSADAVFAGSAPEALLKERIYKGKLLLRYSERPLKSGMSIWKYPIRFLKFHLQNPIGKPVYLLCASAYTAADYRKFLLFHNRAYRWGYFPETMECDIDSLLEKKEELSVLWCGRFLDWKHPDDALLAAKNWKENGIPFHLRFVGTGEMETVLKEQCRLFGLSDCVEFLGSMSPEKVRKVMEQTQIFIATSDFNEGWGAVVNEAMSSGCAVVASHAMGSVPYLISHGENGLIYESGKVDALADIVKALLANPQLAAKLGKAAYYTMVNVWNANNAAERLLKLIDGLLQEKTVFFESGPCSKAKTLPNDWIKR